MAVLDNDHRLVMSGEIKAEWMKHQSPFASTWRMSMISRRRMVPLPPSVERPALRDAVRDAAVESADPNETLADQREMLKDVHLLEAALATDGIIVSLEKNVRRRFHRASTKIVEIADIVWVNPEDEEDAGVGWLSRGAPYEAHRTLGQPVT